MDLLSNLDAARSARVRSCDCRDPKISAAIVATADKLDDLALGACSRADCVRPLARRKRVHQFQRMRLAISAACDSHGRVAHLRGQPAPAITPGCDSRRGVCRIAYSAYLVQKLVIHGVIEFCRAHAIDPKTAPALIGVELCVYAAATILFFTVERPFLQLRHRIASRSRASSLSRNRQGLIRLQPGFLPPLRH